MFQQFFINQDTVMYTIDIYQGNALVNKVQVPEPFAPQQFLAIVQDLAQSTVPMKAVCSYNFETEFGRGLTNSLTFENLKYQEAFK